MTTTSRTPAPGRVPMDPLRRTALVAGSLYLITFVAGIPPAFFLLDPVLSDPNYVIGSGADTSVLLGGLLDLINAFACIGTAVVLFPVVKRQNEAVALGFVASRMMEAAIIIVGVISLGAVVTLRQDLGGAPGADADSLVTAAASLVAVRDWTFLLGPGLMAGVNALLLGYVMYRSRLVPRVIPLMGLVGAPFFLVSAAASILGFNEQISVWSAIALPLIFFWELSLGLWLVIKGFRPSPITARQGPPVERDAALSPA
jgi:hypothetical protein